MHEGSGQRPAVPRTRLPSWAELRADQEPSAQLALPAQLWEKCAREQGGEGPPKCLIFHKRMEAPPGEQLSLSREVAGREPGTHREPLGVWPGRDTYTLLPHPWPELRQDRQINRLPGDDRGLPGGGAKFHLHP